MCAETKEPPLDQMAVCQSFHERRVEQRSQDAQRLGVPLIFSEFGACMGTEACIQEINLVTKAMDDHLVSWAYWEFKNFADLTTSAGTGSEGFYNTDGTLQNDKVRALARTYLPAVQGLPISFDFDESWGPFTAYVKIDTSIDAPTIIFKSDQYFYLEGYVLIVLDDTGYHLARGKDMRVTEPKANYVGV